MKLTQKNLMAFAVSLLLSGLAMAQTAQTPEQSIAAALVTILAIIAVGGAGYITLKLAHVGWVVGAKFISRLGGKAY